MRLDYDNLGATLDQGISQRVPLVSGPFSADSLLEAQDVARVRIGPAPHGEELRIAHQYRSGHLERTGAEALIHPRFQNIKLTGDNRQK